MACVSDVKLVKFRNLIDSDASSPVSPIIERYTDIMKKVDQPLLKGSCDYQLFIDCSKLLVVMEDEAVRIGNLIHGKYESLVNHPMGIDYDLLIGKLDCEMDILTVDDIRECLTPESITIVYEALDASDRLLFIDAAKKKVLEFLENRVGYIAPNLAALVGNCVAAKLIGTAGGVSELANMTHEGIPKLGAERVIPFWVDCSRFGFLDQTDLYESVPYELQARVGKFFASKSLLAARVDSRKGEPSGNYGRVLRGELWQKIYQWLEAIRIDNLERARDERARQEFRTDDQSSSCAAAALREWENIADAQLNKLKATLAAQQWEDKRMVGRVSVWYKLQAFFLQ